MKKKLTLIFLMFLSIVIGGCSSTGRFLQRDVKVKYNDIRAIFVTTQGEIEVYLYPEAAPLTVANFINLAKRGYYDNTKIHRAIENFMAQGGDPTGTGEGDAGYVVPDEITDWLDFFQPGMLAMANRGPETASSQFFITTQPTDWLNGVHTVFGELKDEADYKNTVKLEVGDVIKEIRIVGNADLILSLHKDQLEQWNKVLDQKYPNLEKYEIKPISQFPGEKEAYEAEVDAIFQRKNEISKDVKLSPIPLFLKKVGDAFKKDETGEEIETKYFE